MLRGVLSLGGGGISVLAAKGFAEIQGILKTNHLCSFADGGKITVVQNGFGLRQTSFRYVPLGTDTEAGEEDPAEIGVRHAAAAV